MYRLAEFRKRELFLKYQTEERENIVHRGAANIVIILETEPQMIYLVETCSAFNAVPLISI